MLTTNNATFALKSLKQVKKEHFQKHLPIRNYWQQEVLENCKPHIWQQIKNQR